MPSGWAKKKETSSRRHATNFYKFTQRHTGLRLQIYIISSLNTRNFIYFYFHSRCVYIRLLAFFISFTRPSLTLFFLLFVVHVYMVNSYIYFFHLLVGDQCTITKIFLIHFFSSRLSHFDFHESFSALRQKLRLTLFRLFFVSVYTQIAPFLQSL